jgi:hypothetical protein
LRQGVARLFVVFCHVVVIATFLQEFYRSGLPEFLSARIYAERHSLAGGVYNESVFASPQILAQVLLCSLTLVASYVASREKFTIISFLLAGLGFCATALALALTRIRTGLVFAVFALGLIWLLSAWVRGRSAASVKRLRLLFLVGFAALGIVAVLFIVLGGKSLADADSSFKQDSDFFGYLFDPGELMARLTYGFSEIGQELPGHDWFLGYGAGAGSLRKFFQVPLVYDTGLFLIYHEFGALGLSVFCIAYVGLTVDCFRRLFGAPVSRDVIPSLTIATVFLLWFLLKSHSCMRNGFSHTIWMGMLGISCALLDRCRRGRPITEPIANVSRATCGVKPAHAR